MRVDRARRSHRIQRFASLLCVIVLTTMALPTSGRSQTDVTRVDLAESVLSPVDLAVAGLPGFAVESSGWLAADDAIDSFATAFDADDRDLEEFFDADRGYVAGFDNQLIIESTDGLADLAVQSSLVEFESAAVAEDAFQAVIETADVTAAANDEFGVLGDQSAGFETDASRIIAIQRNRIVGFIVLDSDFVEDAAFAEALSRRTLLLGGGLVANIDAGLAGTGNRLGLKALRFETEEPDRFIANDRYFVLDGQFLPQSSMGETYVDFSTIQVDAFGIQSAYERYLFPNEDDGFAVQINVVEHSTPELAASYLTFTRDRLDFGGGYAELMVFEELSALGVNAVSYTYSIFYNSGFTVDGMIIVMQDGNMTASVEVDGADGVEPGMLIDLAQAQLDCLSTEVCNAIPYPGDDPQTDDDRSTDVLDRSWAIR